MPVLSLLLFCPLSSQSGWEFPAFACEQEGTDKTTVQGEASREYLRHYTSHSRATEIQKGENGAFSC